MADSYSLPKIIKFLENRNFEKFYIAQDYASIYAHEVDEIIIEAPDNKIPDEKITFVIEVLKHLNECVSKAYLWLEHFNLKNDRWYPNALDDGFEISGIYFGKYGYGHRHMMSFTDGFTISFCTKNYYPCEFTIKFHKNMHPFSVEEWVQ
ncbi:MAG: hypothetical protein K2J71_01695 [Oscillospiraceae bacterium]|nr:hypothetical protein [Oscillospiraceae bacterium]